MIPVYKPLLFGNEKKYVNDCIDTTWISSKGKYNDAFANKFSSYIGVKHASTVTNGTVALHLALQSLGIGDGDEVIVPTFTYIASVNAIRYVGARVVFADSEIDTWQISPDDVLKKISSKTKAILVVHLYGHPCDMNRILDIAHTYNLYVIEDCAEAIGTEYYGRKVGSFGDVAAFSFFGNKTITCGEGGMVVTNNTSIMSIVNHLKNQGVSTTKEYWHDAVGYNYRMTNISAAIGLAQLENVEKILERKKHIAEYYFKCLDALPIVFLKQADNCLNSYWMVSFRCSSERERDELRNYLLASGIETRPTFYPVHLMDMYKGDRKSTYNTSMELGLSGLNLPSFPGIREDELDYICTKIKAFYKV